MVKEILRAAFDGSPAHIAILDGDGCIQLVNEAWREYANANDSDPTADWIGMNYLQVCETSAQNNHPDARIMLTGFEAVFSGKADQFQHIYPCHSPIQQAWYLARVVPLEVDKQRMYMVSHEDRSVEVMMRHALEKHSGTDTLTGMVNRSGYRDLLNRQWRRDLRTKSEMSIIVIGVDGYDSYRDQYGEIIADQCVVSVARAINLIVRRPNDFAARTGEDEFTVLLGATSQAEALELSERLRHNVESIGLPHCSAANFDVVTVSIGISSVTPHRHLQPAQLSEKANDAFYRASSSGQNRISL